MRNLSIIITSRNAANLVPCVKAIRDAGEMCRIILVDDGIDIVKACDDDDFLTNPLHIVRGKKPFVFARNVNVGILAAGTDDVIILSDEALLRTRTGLSAMQALTYAPWRAAGLSEYGIVSAATNKSGNPNQLQKIRPTRRGDNMIIRIETHMLCFFCVLIPRSTIDAVGLLDESSTDDDDYSLRVRKAGLKLGVYDGCYVEKR